MQRPTHLERTPAHALLVKNPRGGSRKLFQTDQAPCLGTFAYPTLSLRVLESSSLGSCWDSAVCRLSTVSGTNAPCKDISQRLAEISRLLILNSSITKFLRERYAGVRGGRVATCSFRVWCSTRLVCMREDQAAHNLAQIETT